MCHECVGCVLVCLAPCRHPELVEYVHSHLPFRLISSRLSFFPLFLASSLPCCCVFHSGRPPHLYLLMFAKLYNKTKQKKLLNSVKKDEEKTCMTQLNNYPHLHLIFFTN